MTHIFTIIVMVGIGINKKLARVSFFVGSTIVCLIVSALLLTDYGVYADIFRAIKLDEPLLDQLSLLYGEIGYLAVNYVFKPLTENFNYLRFLFLLSALVLKYLFLFRWGKFYIASFVFYIAITFYPDSYLIRSSFASSIALLGFWVILSGRSAGYFFLSIILASLFHISALVLLPLWWLRNITISKSLGFTLLGVIIGLGAIGVGHITVGFLSTVFSVDGAIVSRLIEYSGSKYSVSAGLIRVSVLIYTIIVFAFIFYRDNIASRIRYYDFIATILLFSLFILLGFSDFIILADRIFRLTAFFFAIALGLILYSLKKRDQTIVSTLVIAVCNIAPYYTDAGPYMLL